MWREAQESELPQWRRQASGGGLGHSAEEGLATEAAALAEAATEAAGLATEAAASAEAAWPRSIFFLIWPFILIGIFLQGKFKILLCSTLPRRGWKTRNEKNRGALGASIAISARSTSISRRVMQRRPTATVAAPANNDLAAILSQLRSQAGLSALDFD